MREGGRDRENAAIEAAKRTKATTRNRQRSSAVNEYVCVCVCV